ncbi:MAG: hypothetical protein MAG451_00655 [Anaerolineales bacterium]|nr:hypothetical protein [Anaerolineales bacterium]
MPPLEMNRFWPLMTYSSPSRSARVVMAETSVPASGSVTAKAPSFTSPGSARRGSHWAFCSSLPMRRMGIAASSEASTAVAMPAQPQKSSSAIRA